VNAVTDQRVLYDLYESGIKFEVCCSQGDGFRIRLGSPATGFSAAVIVDTHAAAVKQLGAMVIQKYPESRFAQKYAMRNRQVSPPLVPDAVGRKKRAFVNDETKRPAAAVTRSRSGYS
jgi:hypothetical protein